MVTLRLVPASGAPVEITQDQAMVGRDPTCPVVLNDGSVSRKHARLERRADAWAVVDQGSANGTFVDSQRVADVTLRTGQELRFGAVAFRVEIEGAPAQEVTLTGEPAATVIQAVPLALPVARPPEPPPAAPRPPRPPEPPAAAPPPSPPAPTRPVPPLPTRPGAPPSPRPPAAPPPPPPSRLAGPGGSPVPPMAASPRPPAKKGRGPLFWVGAGCCGCLTLVLLFVALIIGVAWFGTKGAVDAVEAQLADIKRGQIEAAYGRLSESYRSQMNLREFQRLVAAHPALKDNADASFFPPRGSRKVVNDTAVLTGVLTSTSGRREEVTFRLVKEGGAWKIAAIAFAGESSSGGGGPPPGAADEGPSGASALDVKTLDIGKSAAGEGTKVTIKVRVTGFSVRPEGGAYRIDLAEDLETLGPDGERIEGLSKSNIHRLNQATSAASGNYADFTTDLSFSAGSPEGTYTARLTVRDLVGGGLKASEVPFDLP